MKKVSILILFLIAVFCVTAKAQTTNPLNKPKVLVDNNKVKVTQYISEPGKDVCGVGKHSHPPHLTVLLTDATVTVTSADGKTITQKARPVLLFGVMPLPTRWLTVVKHQ